MSLNTLDISSAPYFVITPLQNNPILVSAYRGQDFIWRQTPLWNAALPQDWIRWIALREMPQTGETIILWARDDLFLDSASESNPSSFSQERVRRLYPRELCGKNKMTKQTPPSIIALDGPAASGKSTLGRRLADSLGYLFFDTGVMYRAITWIALQHDMNLRDEAAITELAQKAQIDIRPPSKDDGRACDVVIGEKDVTWDMRGEDVDANVSVVSAYAGVRTGVI